MGKWWLGGGGGGGRGSADLWRSIVFTGSLTLRESLVKPFSCSPNRERGREKVGFSLSRKGAPETKASRQVVLRKYWHWS